MPATHVSEITAATFQKDVVETSMTKPVLLDFWAAWCEPCRTLGPVLDKLAAEFNGGFVLGKVDTEREQDLAYAFGVQGIPFCVLVDGGRPIDAFQGALPDAEVRRFLQRNGVEPVVLPDAPPPPAPTALDPKSPAGRVQQALAAVRRGDGASVRTVLEAFPEEDPGADVARRLIAGADWLDAKLDAKGPAAEAALADARRLVVAGDVFGAMARLVDSVTADKSLRGGLARKGMLVCFALVGEDDERLDPFRRRLATLLY